MPFLHIPGVPFASKVDIFKLVMFFSQVPNWAPSFISKFDAETRKNVPKCYFCYI